MKKVLLIAGVLLALASPELNAAGGGGVADQGKKNPAAPGMVSKLYNGAWSLGSYSLKGGVAGLGLWGAYKGYAETAKIEDSGKRLAAQGLLVGTVSSVGSGLGVLYLLRSNGQLSAKVDAQAKDIKAMRDKMAEEQSEEALQAAQNLQDGADAALLANHRISRLPGALLKKSKGGVSEETDQQLLERIRISLHNDGEDAKSEAGD